MGRKADYNLEQALQFRIWNIKRFRMHHKTCTKCNWLFDVKCDECIEIEDNIEKWRRRAKYAARREGVKITL
jgi:Fe2+ or Zn2+ uptake regulation protein